MHVCISEVDNIILDKTDRIRFPRERYEEYDRVIKRLEGRVASPCVSTGRRATLFRTIIRSASRLLSTGCTSDKARTSRDPRRTLEGARGGRAKLDESRTRLTYA